MISAHTYKCRYLFRIHNNSFDNSVKNHDFMNSVGNLESKCYLCVEIILEE